MFEYEWHKTNLLLRFTTHRKMGRIRQPKRRKSMKQVWNIMTQFWNCLTQVWNWNRILFKDIFRDEIELFLEWKWIKKVWKTLGIPFSNQKIWKIKKKKKKKNEREREKETSRDCMLTRTSYCTHIFYINLL